MIIIASLVAVAAAITLYLLIQGQKRYKSLIEQYKDQFQLTFLAPAILYLLQNPRISTILAHPIQQIHVKIVRLYGRKEGHAYTKMFIAQNIAAGILLFLIFGFFSLMQSGDMLTFIFGCVLAVIVPAVMFKQLDKKLLEKQREVIIALPEFLNKLLLLINAGESLQRALIQAIHSGLVEQEAKDSKTMNFLYKELKIVLKELENNQSLTQVMEEFNQRLAIHEVSMAVTVIVLNQSRGSADLTTALASIIKELWDKRKAQVKILGEEASSKLVFPMVIIFLVVAIIIATPALLSF